jgi:multiple sugar transport system substrate-binding protein
MVSRRAIMRSVAGALGAGALAGCGSGSSSSKGRTIKQWYHQYGETGTQQAAQRYAKAYPDATVSVQWIPGDYTTKLSSGLLSGDGPDVFETQLNVELVRAKQIVALDDIIGPDIDDFTPATRGLATVDGKVYGIPMIEDMQLLYYRKSLLSKAGVAVPASTDELIAAARALTTKDVKGLFVGNDGGISVLGGPSLWSVGADYPRDASWPGFSDALAPALARLRQLYTSGSLLLGAPTDWSDPSAIVTGLTAMQWTGLWAQPAIQQAWGDDIGVAAWPALGAAAAGAGAPSVPIGTWNAMVSAKSGDIDAAKAYVKWLWIDHKDYQKDWAQSYGTHIPPRKSVAATADKLSAGLAGAILDLSNRYAKAAGPPSWTPKMSTAYTDALSKIILRGADAAKELATAEGTVRSELKRLYG